MPDCDSTGVGAAVDVCVLGGFFLGGAPVCGNGRSKALLWYMPYEDGHIFGTGLRLLQSSSPSDRQVYAGP